MVRLEPGLSTAAPSIDPAPAPSGGGPTKPTTLTEEAFYEQIAKVDAALPARLKAFVAALEPLGVYPEYRASLLLKWTAPDGRVATLAMIDPQGRVQTDGVYAYPTSLGRLDLSDGYKAALAAIVPGGTAEATGRPSGARLLANGRTPTLAALLAPDGAWLAAVSSYTDALRGQIAEEV